MKQKKQISKRSKIIFMVIMVTVVTIINAVLCDEGERFDGLVRVMTESLDKVEAVKMEYVTSVEEIPAQAMKEMQAVAEKQFRDYIGEFPEYRLDGYQYLGSCFLSIKKKDKTKAQNELYLLYRAKLTVQVSEEEERSYDWFYYVSFSDIQAGKNEAYAVNLEVYNTPSWLDSPDNNGYSYALQSYTRSLYGYKSLKQLCDRLNSSQTQKYYNVEKHCICSGSASCSGIL